jgi:L-methionine (R)-S-oxide reductase
MSRSGALEAIDRILNRGGQADEVLQAAVDVLHDRFDDYSWVGIYLVEGDDLVLGPWKGPQATDHVRIPVGQGICGAAAATGQTEVVDDVNADERYLACFPSTRSEIVVPIAYEGRVVGEIDIDSDRPAAFGQDDRAFLERLLLQIILGGVAAIGVTAKLTWRRLLHTLRIRRDEDDT